MLLNGERENKVVWMDSIKDFFFVSLYMLLWNQGFQFLF